MKNQKNKRRTHKRNAGRVRKAKEGVQVARPSSAATPVAEASLDSQRSYETTLVNLRQLISRTYFWNEGDGDEQKHWLIFRERFPNLEHYWRHFIVPTSRRIELPRSDPRKIERRKHVDDKLWGATFLHYSIFLHLTYAHEHMSGPLASSFGDFYTHLVSASDLVQEFLLKTYGVILECQSTTSQVMQRLTREEFLKYAGEWYDTKYGNIYEHYLEKGKWSPIRIPTRSNVITEYMEHTSTWKDYERFDRSVREYRNILVHREAVGEVILNPGISLVPRREKIQAYVTLKEVFQAADNPERLSADFISKQEQMLKDFFEIQIRLNDLWGKPIADMNSLLFEERNEKLCAKYGIRFH